ncbi:hypothetical protein CNR22_04165 [Sphingobacteriaceae bacterium]|nr:hypothetical protein CNR22_04165 [Sphingobacteriaceae bacterium]
MTNFLNANWDNIVMANYAVPEEVLVPYLPKGCELDLYQGSAYVSLVGFMFKNTRLFQIPIPWLGTFEEINLRFYVTRKENGEVKRGVVFINETIPYKAVAWVANKLYKEHYTTVPTRNLILSDNVNKVINYQWKMKDEWNSIYVKAHVNKQEMPVGSFEEFIFEHYYGYTKLNAFETDEYKIHHPRWHLNKIEDFLINCAFDKMYGEDFSFLNRALPASVFLAEGSEVSVQWRRNRLKLNAE